MKNSNEAQSEYEVAVNDLMKFCADNTDFKVIVKEAHYI